MELLYCGTVKFWRNRLTFILFYRKWTYLDMMVGEDIFMWIWRNGGEKKKGCPPISSHVILFLFQINVFLLPAHLPAGGGAQNHNLVFEFQLPTSSPLPSSQQKGLTWPVTLSHNCFNCLEYFVELEGWLSLTIRGNDTNDYVSLTGNSVEAFTTEQNEQVREVVDSVFLPVPDFTAVGRSEERTGSENELFVWM